jgi:hypothetical protein
MIIYGIYKYKKLVYIGQTRQSLRHRVYKYKSDTKLKRNTDSMPIIRAMLKYGFSAFEFKELACARNLQDLDYLECSLIAKYVPKYQASPGGVFNKKCTEATRRKISQANRHRNPGQFRIKSIICVDTGHVFCSISEASRILSVNRRSICNCLNGWSKSAGGYSFQYLPNKLSYNDQCTANNSVGRD